MRKTATGSMEWPGSSFLTTSFRSLSARMARTPGLPVKLTRWKIDIKSNAQMEEEMERMDSGEEPPEL